MERATETGTVITQERIVFPVKREFEEAASKPADQAFRPLPSESEKSVHGLFSEQEYGEENIRKAEEILVELAGEFSDGELRDLVAQVMYLAESWLDDFERDIFKGMTLRELLHERTGK